MVIDQGGSNGENGSTSLGRLAQTSPAIVFNLLQQLESLGINVPSVMQQLGVTPAVVASAAAPPTVAAVVVPPKLD